MSKLYDVIGVGVSAVDDLLYVAGYPPKNVKVPIEGSERHGGGPACTAMAAVGTLEGRCAYLGRLGSDELSRFIEASLRKHHVDTSHFIPDSSAAPYHSFIIVDASGSRNVFYDPSMYRPALAGDISEELIGSTKLVLLDHVADPAPLAVAEKVRSLGVPIVGDIEGQSEAARHMAEIADYLIVPEEFALWASGENNLPDACRALARTSRRVTIVTAGADGCYWMEATGNVIHLPAFRVDSFDTNGCGDTFHGAYALSIARGFSPPEAILFASAAAALKAHARGGKKRGWDALPTLEEVILFLRSQTVRSYPPTLLEKIAGMHALPESKAHISA